MSLKYNIKQRNKTIQGLRSFKDTLPTKVKRILNKKGQIYSKTLDNWKYIVGQELFKVCYPKSFKTSNKLEKNTTSKEVDADGILQHSGWFYRLERLNVAPEKFSKNLSMRTGSSGEALTACCM